MFCPKCGSKNNENANSCSSCYFDFSSRKKADIVEKKRDSSSNKIDTKELKVNQKEKIIYDKNMKGDLVITTNVDCIITVNGKKEKTKDKYLFLNNIPYGEVEIIGETETHNSFNTLVIDKQLTKAAITLENKVVSLYAKSKIGDFKMIMTNKTYNCPELIEGIPANLYQIKIEYKEKVFFDSMDLTGKNEFEYELTDLRIKEIEKKNEEAELESILLFPERNFSDYNNKINELERFLNSIIYKEKLVDEVIKAIADLCQKAYDKISSIPETDVHKLKEKYKMFLEFSKNNNRFFKDEIKEEINRLKPIVLKNETKINKKNKSRMLISILIKSIISILFVLFFYIIGHGGFTMAEMVSAFIISMTFIISGIIYNELNNEKIKSIILIFIGFFIVGRNLDANYEGYRF